MTTYLVIQFISVLPLPGLTKSRLQEPQPPWEKWSFSGQVLVLLSVLTSLLLHAIPGKALFTVAAETHGQSLPGTGL
jgi:hypothetical protein